MSDCPHSSDPGRNRLLVMRTVVTLILIVPPLGLVLLWICAAVWIDGPEQRVAAGLLTLTIAVLGLFLLIRIRPRRRGLAGFGVLFAVILAWWLSLAPSNGRQWRPDVARLPAARLEGDRLTISNLRNFTFASDTDFTERWEERTYDLSKLTGVDLFLCYWGSPWIAHTIMSWQFEDAPPLAISIETRKETDEEYSTIAGFFRRYELYYVVADERDLIPVRVNTRGEEIYLYRLAASPELARGVLLDYLREINELAEKPRWYNALTHNCTTVIRNHIQAVVPDNPWNWRILLNGKLDEMAYSRGAIHTGLPFDEVRRRSLVVEQVKRMEAADDFSMLIRAGLPPRPR